MKTLCSSLAIVLTTSVAFCLSLGDIHPFSALKQSDLIVVGVATDMTIIPHPNVPTNTVARILSHGRLKVHVKRTVIPADAKVADTLEVDYGYNPGDSSWKAYKEKELVYILRVKEENTNGVITRAQALRFWYFAYRSEDLDRVLQLRSQLQSGVDPKSLTNDIPTEVFSDQ